MQVSVMLMSRGLEMAVRASRGGFEGGFLQRAASGSAPSAAIALLARKRERSGISWTLLIGQFADTFSRATSVISQSQCVRQASR
jgi:hypothetical protein